MKTYGHIVDMYIKQLLHKINLLRVFLKIL